MTVQAWSGTAANNVLANTGFTMDEGMAPSAVNDSVRQLMADVKTRFDADYATTATAAGTTTLTSASVSIQVFTGVTTQTLVLPVATTLTTGRSWLVVNSSTGAVTINSSGSNLVHTIQAGGKVVVMCILASGTDAASWLVLTAAKTDAAQTFTGVQSMTSPDITTSITTPSTTFACFNATATTVNAFGAASVALNIGHASAAAAFAGGISIPTSKNVTGAGTATVVGFKSGSFGTAGNQGSLLLLGSTSGTATFSTDATTTKVTLDKALDIGANALTAGAISGTTLTASADFITTADQFIYSSNGGGVRSGWLLKGSTGELISYSAGSPIVTLNGIGINGVLGGTTPAAATVTTAQITTPGAFASGDKYLIVDASGNIHVSALGPLS